MPSTLGHHNLPVYLFIVFEYQLAALCYPLSLGCPLQTD